MTTTNTPEPVAWYDDALDVSWGKTPPQTDDPYKPLYPESALQAERERADMMTLQYDAELRFSEKIRKELAALKEALRNPTEATAGSVRGVLQMLRGKPGVTFDEIKTHCMMRGDDLSWWPQWADEAGASYVTEQGAAMLLLAGMVAPLIKD